MHIDFVEVQNFRKLKSVRIDFDRETTVFVGANNSGKTSAMVALSLFLLEKTNFSTNEFTLSNWSKINSVGNRWETDGLLENWQTAEVKVWEDVLPAIDVWLHVEPNEIHHVIHLLPSSKWKGGLIGVRLRLEPNNIEEFFKEFINVRKEAKQTIAEANVLRKKQKGSSGHTQDSSSASSDAQLVKTLVEDYSVSLWPKDMCEFLERRLNRLMKITAYNLDPTQCVPPKKGQAFPQNLPEDSLPLDQDPFKKLIRIDKIDAHRGFSNLSVRGKENENEIITSERGKLSEQLRAYYKKHLDPSTMPEPRDIDALEAIYQAQTQFDEKLKVGFESSFKELESLGYPGVSDPKLELSTKIKPVDGLNHPSALKYVVTSQNTARTNVAMTLPEQYNGLGYQNLISMVFKLMSFRDEWMQVGKFRKLSTKPEEEQVIAPLHLVLIEEPEAHLHVQVQQVFIRKAYSILRKHDDLGDKKSHCTQLVISSHSSHVAHECDFSSLRYFRRKPATSESEVPITTVVNLSKVFGTDDETPRFVSRYIKATHCDLFFADGAILVEGPAERMLVPHFIRENFPSLNQSYITVLEIGGSHAHRLKPLLDHLGLTTLIITDLDSASPIGHHASVRPKRNEKQITRNNVLKSWVPAKEKIDELLALTSKEKEIEYDEFYSVRAAFQVPLNITLEGSAAEEVLCYTFEDAFVFENHELIKNLKAAGMAELFAKNINEAKSPIELSEKLYETIKAHDGKKAEFSLNILYYEEPKKLKVPKYIEEGLAWLEDKMKVQQKESLVLTPERKN